MENVKENYILHGAHRYPFVWVPDGYSDNEVAVSSETLLSQLDEDCLEDVHIDGQISYYFEDGLFTISEEGAYEVDMTEDDLRKYIHDNFW